MRTISDSLRTLPLKDGKNALAKPLVLSVFAICAASARADNPISARDDTDTMVTVSGPARRIVSLAPHATELLFAAGAGDRIVGTVRYSDYPPAAGKIPRVGDNLHIDVERLLALKPDLLVVWQHNASPHLMERLRALGIPLYYSDPRTLQDIPASILKLGRLTGTQQTARQNAATLQSRIGGLAARYRDRPVIRVFYQVWDQPLYTLNERHIVTDMIRLCGGENIFATLPAAAPGISPEAVLQENPEAIVSGDRRDLGTDGLDIWKQYPALLAVKRGNLFAVDADLMHRAGPRAIDGAAKLCALLEQARARRGEQQ